MASYLHRTAQPFTLAIFRSWGSSTGAGRIRLAGTNIGNFDLRFPIAGLRIRLPMTHSLCNSPFTIEPHSLLLQLIKRTLWNFNLLKNI